MKRLIQITVVVSVAGVAVLAAGLAGILFYAWWL